MNFTKKIDRAFQWAGEKMGGEARTALPDDFKILEAETTMRQEGMERIQKSMNTYVKWATRRCDAFEDKERATPAAFVGRTFTTHGEEFSADSQFGDALVTMGQANERIAQLQDAYIENMSATWLAEVERTVAMMKEYSTSRKKLENRRLAYDASLAKMDKARREDYRIEEEVRMNRAKFEETSEDVFRRMQDIKDSEMDTAAAMTSFLDAQLDYHERAAEELRRARQAWTAPSPSGGMGMGTGSSPPRTARRPSVRSRSNTARSWNEPRQSAVFEQPELEEEAPPVRSMPMRSARPNPPPPPQPPRPSMNRATTYDSPRIGQPVPTRGAAPTALSRIATDQGTYHHHSNRTGDDVFGDDASTASGSGSPDWGDRSASPATSYGSMSRSGSAVGLRKAPPPPPPPVNRAKKPAPPPVPAKRVY